MKILNHFDYFIQVILIVFLLAAAIQLLYYLLVYMRIVICKKKQNAGNINGLPSVSVIICARNEENNLTSNLKSVLEQEYHTYEVIVVNDCSEDNTEEVLASFKQQYPHLRSTIIKMNGSFRNSKKFAATVGIKAAQYEWLLFTDADCRPESPKWIESMSRNFVDRKDIVLGYGGYMSLKGILNKWIRYDTCFIALQYFGFAMAGMPYMGVGRNLAYRKSLFYAHNGFAAHAHIASGDDDLFVNQAATRNNVAVELSSDSHTRSVPKETFKQWVWQKRRHLTTSKYYKSGQSFLLAFEPFSRVLLWASFCVLMIKCILWQYVLIVFLVRMITFTVVIDRTTRKLNEKGILPYSALFDLAIPFIYLYIFLLNRISSKQNRWK